MAVVIAVVVVTSLGFGLYNFKKGSTVGKLLILEVTLGKIAEKPLFGYGVGRFEAEYNNWQSEYFQKHPDEMNSLKSLAAGNTKYAFNEYLEFTVELGILGLLLFLSLIAMVIINIPINDKMTIPLFGILSSILICAVFSFPFYSLPTFILLFFILAIFSSIKSQSGKKVNIFPRISKILSLLSCGVQALVLICCVFIISFTGNQYYGYYKWDEADKLYNKNSFKEACQSFFNVYDILKYNGGYLQYYGKACYNNKELRKSQDLFCKAIHYTSDEILYTSLGDVYKSLKQNKEAEQSYYHASFMVPHKFYPLYLLVKLYEETDDHEKAHQLASLLLSKKIKISSTAIDQIQFEMRKILDN